MTETWCRLFKSEFLSSIEFHFGCIFLLIITGYQLCQTFVLSLGLRRRAAIESLLWLESLAVKQGSLNRPPASFIRRAPKPVSGMVVADISIL